MGNFGIEAGKAALNVGTGIVGTAAGYIFAGANDKRQIRQQKKLNQLALDSNKDLAQYNYDLEMQKWHDTNYSAQMAELKQAGLNPGLMYGMSGGGGVTAQTKGAEGISAQAAPKGGGEQLMAIQSMKELALLDAQKRNIDADTANKQADTANKPKEGANIDASTASITQGIKNQQQQQKLAEAETNIKNIDLKFAQDSYQNRLQQIETDLNNGIAVLRSNEVAADINEQTVNDRIKQIQAEAQIAVLRTTLTEAETALTRQQTRESASNVKYNTQAIEKMKAEIQNMKDQINVAQEQNAIGWAGNERNKVANAINAARANIEARAQNWNQDHPELSQTFGKMIGDMKDKIDKILKVHY